ncbi:MAG TPA: hypothetical protein VLV50_01040, partial [Stellaceae bacterium]|nr:hypothetical protein [Stellaceae bacterium]
LLTKEGKGAVQFHPGFSGRPAAQLAGVVRDESHHPANHGGGMIAPPICHRPYETQLSCRVAMQVR